MKKSKLLAYAMTGALSLGIVGGTGIQASAATDPAPSPTAVEQDVNVKASLEEETKQKGQDMMDQLNTQLAELGAALPATEERDTHSGPFADLDKETKEKVQAMIEQLKVDTTTPEEAQAQLDAAQTQLTDLGGGYLSF